MKRVLSQIDVPWAWALKRGLGDLYRLHQWIWDALPRDEGAKRDFLFRSDLANGNFRILLLSEREPNDVEGYHWKRTKLSDTFLQHQAYAFKVKVNPTFRRKADHRRLALFDEQRIIDWVTRKFDAIGCRVENLSLTAPQKHHFKKSDKQGTVVTVDVSGLLYVRDAEAFKQGVDAGIGPAKGFGHGLLMLQPIH